MKRNLLLTISLFIIAFVAKSQITITQSNMPIAGKQAVEVKDTICTGITVGGTGSQTWNFTNIANQGHDTTSYVNPSILTGSSSFPTSNIALIEPSGDYSFYLLNANAFDMLGAYSSNITSGGGSTTYTYNTPFRAISLPATYQSIYTGTTSATILMAYPNPPMDSMRIIISHNYTNDIDAYGTITTPAYTNIACLRQKSKVITSFQIDIHMLGSWQSGGAPSYDTTNGYIWFSNTVQHPIATITTNDAGVIKDAMYLLTYQTGIPKSSIAKKNITIYPNPATDNINISGITELSVIVITDMSGRVISNTALFKNNSTIDVSNYNNGIYFYNVVNSKGTNISKGKFIVAK